MGVVADGLTRQAVLTLTVERGAGIDEIFRRFVRPDGERCSASGDIILGVCPQKSTTPGELVPVDVLGVVPVEAGAAVPIAAGAVRVMSDAQGRAVRRSGSNAAVGIALAAAAAAGDVIPVLLQVGHQQATA